MVHANTLSLITIGLLVSLMFKHSCCMWLLAFVVNVGCPMGSMHTKVFSYAAAQPLPCGKAGQS
jgi:hypothetical protein